MLEWYFPWSNIDLILRVELIIWLAVVAVSYGIFWRVVVRKRPWLMRGQKKR
ncbi:MAG: hypothetical protein QNJ73_03645 [Gammaproteobacteria bacterium]|nr:hypothetical protein [Gammaproteobacteria bacterium]